MSSTENIKNAHSQNLDKISDQNLNCDKVLQNIITIELAAAQPMLRLDVSETN